jgi:GT2 family glycosyltransferase
VRLRENLGYAGGMNAGIRRAVELGASWVWLLNADTVPDQGALSALLELSSDYQALASQQFISQSPDAPERRPHQSAAHVISGKLTPIRCAGCAQGGHPAEMLAGASLFLYAPHVLRVGGFDERFFHYKEEIDLMFRMARAGTKLGLCCRSQVWHACGGSLARRSPLSRYYLARNELLYLRKHYDQPFRWPIRDHARLARDAALTLSQVVRGQRDAVGALLGLWDGVRGISGPARRPLSAEPVPSKSAP